jgi:hypothetical protein
VPACSVPPDASNGVEALLKITSKRLGILLRSISSRALRCGDVRFIVGPYYCSQPSRYLVLLAGCAVVVLIQAIRGAEKQV